MATRGLALKSVLSLVEAKILMLQIEFKRVVPIPVSRISRRKNGEAQPHIADGLSVNQQLGSLLF